MELSGCPELEGLSGGDSGGEPPVPIPNTEVKPASADGTWGATPWESRSPPDIKRRRGHRAIDGPSFFHPEETRMARPSDRNRGQSDRSRGPGGDRNRRPAG